MEAKSFVKRIIVGICMMVMLTIICIPSTVHAATELMSEKGNLGSNEQKEFYFQVPVESTVSIVFDDSTYGKCLLKIKNSVGNVVFEDSDYIPYDEKTFSTVLPAGNYTLVIQEIYKYRFRYSFSMNAVPTMSVPTETLTLNKKNISLAVGEKYSLTEKYTPAYATDTIAWKSSNKKVATVDSMGNVQAKGLGKATITVQMGSKKANCTVTVNSTYVEIVKGKSAKLKTLAKNIKGYKKAKWKVGSTSVASVKSGKIRGNSHGQTKIKAKISGKTYTITAYVYDHDVLVKNAKRKLKSLLKNPKSLIINKIYGKGNFVVIDYSAMNGFGGYNRSDFTAWYEKGKFCYYVF
ncbi:MAG: Ig domain-containing protein [Lachnospiraceae bacterium]|nr:Ig domain-containing protein [Lachnospiraceae bacterium]